MSNRKLPSEGADEVSRLRRVRDQLVRDHGGQDGFFAWVKEQEAKRLRRKSKAAAGQRNRNK